MLLHSGNRVAVNMCSDVMRLRGGFLWGVCVVYVGMWKTGWDACRRLFNGTFWVSRDSEVVVFHNIRARMWKFMGSVVKHIRVGNL